MQGRRSQPPAGTDVEQPHWRGRAATFMPDVMRSMTGLQLSIRSAMYYWRAHLSVFLGVALAGAILVGAMLVGDSVKFSLGQSARLRLGSIHHALSMPGRFCRQDLADRLGNELRITVVPALLLHGIAMKQDDGGMEDRQANNVQIIGIDETFSRLADGKGAAPGEGDIAVNEKLAALLHIKPGDRLSIRIGKPSLFPKDVPLASRARDDTSRETLVVGRIVTDVELGRFSLAANQIVPCNAFVNLKWLQKVTDLQDRVNLLLAGCDRRLVPPNVTPRVSPRKIGGDAVPLLGELNAAIKRVWRIEDAGLSLRAFTNQGLIQLESDRIFIEPAISTAVLAAPEDCGPPSVESGGCHDSEAGIKPLSPEQKQHIPGYRHEWKPVGALTYLVNSISRDTNGGSVGTPYSFVTAISPSSDRKQGPVPQDMADDEIILSRWLADCLAARIGETVRVAYFELAQADTWVEKSMVLRIRDFVEMDEIAAERDLSPKFPGLTDVDRCAEWDIGIPLDKEQVKDKANELYWKAYRATPKAFVTLKAGQAMWANRFGNMSAVRYAANANNAEEIAEGLRRKIDPVGTGLSFAPVREQALKAVSEAMDFGQLFLGMSLFLIVAGLMLTGLLFAFGMQQRSVEIGILLAVGYLPGNVRRLLMQESCLIAVAGSLVGALLGMLYARSLIFGLSHYWQGAVANSAIQYNAEPLTTLKGIIACFLCAVVAMAISMRRQLARSVPELLSGDFALSAYAVATSQRNVWILTNLSWAGVVASAGIITSALVTGMHNAVPAFFVAGGLLLLSGLGLLRQVLMKLDRINLRLTLVMLGIRNAGRRRARSLTVAALVACGCFLVLAVSSMREDVGADAAQRSSGTGGFALFGESTLPMQGDLNSEDGRKKYRLDGDPSMANVGFVSIKVRDGDDASCLNLNRAQVPRLFGVDPSDFARRHAFVHGETGGEIWNLLNAKLPDGEVPGLVGDENTAMWGLQKKIGREKGDTLVYRDERGKEFRVKLVGALPMRLSVFQGSVLIQAGAFAAKYPSESGYRMFLVDVPDGAKSVVEDVLSRRLGKLGLDLVPSVDRLREFYAVESTYMAMFLVLGGLGLLLGSVGMGIVVLRNILERRGELGLLKAVGFSNAQLRTVLLVEHWLILGMGLLLGLLSSLAAMWPSLVAPGVKLPYMTMLLFVGGMVVFNTVWILAAARIALHGSGINALRSE